MSFWIQFEILLKDSSLSLKLIEKFKLTFGDTMKKALLYCLCLLLPVTVFAISDPLKKVARNFSKVIKKMDKKATVGLLAFPYHDGRVSSGSSIVSERLTSHMAAIKGLRVVERNLITKIMEEQRLSETGVIDPDTAQKLGKILGVDVIVTGTLIDLGEDRTEINARGLLADTGEVIAADWIIIDRTWKDRPRSLRARPPKKRLPATVESDPAEDEEDDDPIRIGYPSRGGYYGGYGRGYR